MRNFFLSVSFIVSVQVSIFPLNMCDIIIYFARWWEKYLSKDSLIKHTCSWHDKLIVLWTLNRQAKIFLHIIFLSKIKFTTYFGRWKGWVKLGTTQWFWTESHRTPGLGIKVLGLKVAQWFDLGLGVQNCLVVCPSNLCLGGM